MKKILATIALASLAIASTQAQGYVLFNNNNFVKEFTNTTPGSVGSGLTTATAGSYYYALFYSTTTANVSGQTVGNIGTNSAVTPAGLNPTTNTPSSNPANWVFNAAGWITASNFNNTTPMLGTNGAAGRFAAATTDGTGNAVIGNIGQVVTANFVAVAWSANIGNTLAAFEAYVLLAQQGLAPVEGWIGQSQIATGVVTGNGTTQGAGALFGTSAGLIPTFTLGDVAAVATPEPGTMALVALGGASLLLFRRRK